MTFCDFSINTQSSKLMFGYVTFDVKYYILSQIFYKRNRVNYAVAIWHKFLKIKEVFWQFRNMFDKILFNFPLRNIIESEREKCIFLSCNVVSIMELWFWVSNAFFTWIKWISKKWLDHNGTFFVIFWKNYKSFSKA